MTIDVENDSPASRSASAAEPLLRAVLEALQDDGGQTIIDALRKRVGGPTLIRSFLDQAGLSPDQQSMVELFLKVQGEQQLSGERVAADDDIIDMEPVADDTFNASDRRELRNLRQVNDTLAAALGACCVCWGGDVDCDVCGGRGRAGFASPDLELFDELVAPALKRVLTMRRAGQIGFARNRR